MKKALFSVLMITALLLTTVIAPAVAQSGEPPLEPLYPAPSAETGEMIDETPQLWFVELKSKPTVEGTSKSVLDKEKTTFRSEARRAGVVYQERYAFSTLWNGLSIQLKPGEVAKLSRIPSIKAIYPVATFAIPENQQITPELATAITMTGADIAQTEMGLTGKGVRVAVMDTGVDYDHPDLGGCFGPGCRVYTGWDFVGDAFNADPTSPAYNPIPAPDPDPDDCNGHGTHVAGIVGANGSVMGVAPDVSFGAYRVFGCAGSTTADIMMAAMEMALKDKMHILNMSIGSAFQWPQYPTAVAASRLVDKGMVVVASIGNSGTSGVYAAGAPGLGEKVIGVASFDNSHVSLAAFSISPDDQLIGYGTAAAAPLPPTSGSLPMARTGTTTTTDDGCAPIAADMTGYAVLIRRGTCPFHTKALNAQNAGAAAVILYNNAPGRFSPTVAGTPAITIPVVAISDTEGALIDGRLAVDPVTMTWTDELLVSVNPTGGLISSFSSYGLSPDLALKPDIGAPGGLIYSTYPLEQGAYATISGTSMSSPHVAGGVALLLQAQPKLKAGDVRDILQNSADPKNWWGNPALGFLDNVHRQGAGMLDIPGAIMATTKITPAKLSLGESEHGPHTAKLTLSNSTKKPVTYTLSHVPALSTGGSTFTPGFFTGFASVSFSAPSVTVKAGGKATVTVTITANPALADKSQYGGYLVFMPEGGGDPLRVPYAGFKGDYQSIQVLTSGGFGFPALGWSPNGVNFGFAAEGDVFSLVGYDIPYILVHMDHHASLLQMRILNAHTGQPVHPVFDKFVDLEYLPRNSTSTGFFAFGWDGTRIHNASKSNDLYKLVPDGDYVVELLVLKALGDAKNPAHWESWTSPMFTIARP
jgi:minor extracellular serine protease Vpr